MNKKLFRLTLFLMGIIVMVSCNSSKSLSTKKILVTSEKGDKIKQKENIS